MVDKTGFKTRHNAYLGVTATGVNVVILDGVTIGKGSVIGAGTMVTKDVPAGSILIDKRNKIVRSRK